MNKVRYNSKRSRGKTSSEGNIVSRFLNSGLGQLLLIGVSIFLLLSVYRSFVNMGQRISLLRRAEEEVNELRLENLNLSLQIYDAGNIERLEREARNRLNYGMEGEVVFVIEDDLIEIGKERVLGIVNPPEVSEEVYVLDDWVEFILSGY